MTESTPASEASKTPTPAGNPDAQVRADSHRTNLALLNRMPLELDYVTPEEVLLLVRLANAYRVNWTLGLEAEERDDARAYPVLMLIDGEVELRMVRCRIRIEDMLQHPDGVAIPDGDIVWAQQLIGRLVCAVDQALEATGRR